MDFSWQVHEDTCGSNRFPILLNNTKPTGKKLTGEKFEENAMKN